MYKIWACMRHYCTYIFGYLPKLRAAWGTAGEAFPFGPQNVHSRGDFPNKGTKQPSTHPFPRSVLHKRIAYPLPPSCVRGVCIVSPFPRGALSSASSTPPCLLLARWGVELSGRGCVLEGEGGALGPKSVCTSGHTRFSGRYLWFSGPPLPMVYSHSNASLGVQSPPKQHRAGGGGCFCSCAQQHRALRVGAGGSEGGGGDAIRRGGGGQH